MEMEESVASTILEAELTGIQFGLATHNEIRTSSISDCPISHASQLGNPFLGLPLENGKCESCGTTEPGKCEGHFGYIELPIPIYHPSHVSELKRMLNLICLKCLKMKTSKIPVKNNGVIERLLSACCEEACHVSIKDSKTSDGASFIELRIPGRSRILEGAWNFLDRYGYRYGDGSSRTLLPTEVSTMLKKLPEDTRRKLAKKGYFPQEGYIVRYVPVPPNCLSVPDISDGVSVMSSDLCSAMLKKVIRQIEIIRSSRSGEPNFESHEVEANDLQIAVSQYLQVRGTGKAARDGDKRFGVSKEGSSSSTKAWLEKMRTLFISKGSGYSSRSVITGDAYRPVNEVGIPCEIAQKMTFEEKVNIHNVQYLQRLVDNNLCLTFRDGSSTYSLKEGSKGHTFLRIGQVVHRRIMDGDIVFINRPPTTHKHSLQALRVYIHDDHVVKINPLMCGPLAADFDGDCVHLFYPQSLSARAEVLELFSVDKQLLSSHSGNLNLQLAIDALLSLKTIFKVNFLDKASAQQLAMHTSTPLPAPAVRKASSSGPCWTAHQMLQIALPAQFECRGERFFIHGGELVKLDYNRDAIASVMNEILTSVFFSKSPKDALKFLDSLQPLLMENLFAEGFSVGLEDFFVLSSELETIQSQIQDLISPLLLQLRSSFNELVQLQFESYIRLLKVPISNFVLKFSALGNLIDSRSESAIDKVVQQIGFLGLQLSDRRKFYSKNLVEEVGCLFKAKYPFRSLYPSEEFGLVKSCFFRGLDPYEEMVHSIATREVIVRSSKGLAEPGTLFKNLMAVLRDVVICYDGSVRNVSSNSVIQFEYGLGGVPSQSLFPAGEPVGVLAATAMSNPAYKAVLDSSPSSNSSWDFMKEILFCRVNFKNDVNDRRVILYLNDCGCGRKYCQENASFLVKNHLRKVSLKDAAVEFLIEYKRPKVEPGSADTDTGLVGHVHLDATKLKESGISMLDIQQKCEEHVNILRKKKKFGIFRRVLLSVSECCCFHHSGSRWTDMPCLKFFWQDLPDPQLEKVSHIMADLICPVLLDVIIKGDPRISTVNIVWISPGTTSWVQSPCSNAKGELGVEVTLEKTAVRQSGDAWRIVLDCCLPVFHLVDTRRSIPYAIKQIQDLLGISCAFDQAVQRLSTSVTLVTRGVLKEHLILLANSMTCSGNLVGFNIGGIKALCRALNSQVPFTEATLYTPRKCFERASEKCHVDALAGIVASCSWGKRVAVGTGAKFDVLWDTKEIGMDEKPIDVYNFLHLVRSSNGEEIDSGCLGDDLEKFDMEDTYLEPALSPDQENKAVFEEMIDADFQEQEVGGSSWDALPSSGKGWGASTGSSEDNGWANWGTKKDEEKLKESSVAAGWGGSKSLDSSKEEDKNLAWDSAKNFGQEGVGSEQPGSVSGKQSGQEATWEQPGAASWNQSSQVSSGGWTSKKVGEQAASGGWEAKKQVDSTQSSWGKENGSTWGRTSNDNAKQDAVIESGPDNNKPGWGQPKEASWKINSHQSSDQWSSKKSVDPSRGQDSEENRSSWNPAHNGSGEKSSWEKPGGTPWKKNNSECAGGLSSTQVNQQAGLGSWGSGKKESNESSWGQQSGSASNNNHEANQQSASGMWETQTKGNQTKSSWEHQKNRSSDVGDSNWKNSSQNSDGDRWGSSDKKNNSGGASGWGSGNGRKESDGHGWGSADQKNSSGGASRWGPGDGKKEGGFSSWDSKKDDSKSQPNTSWKSTSQNSDGWGSTDRKNSSGGAGAWNSDTAQKEGGARSWGSKNVENKSQPSWRQPGHSTNSAPKSTGWGADKSSEHGISLGWGSGSSNKDNKEGGWESKKDDNTNPPSSRQPGNTSWNSSSQNAGGWGSADQENNSGGSGAWTSDKAHKESGSKSWDSKKDEKKSQSSWNQPDHSKNSAPNSEGWNADKSGEPAISLGWGSSISKKDNEEGGATGWQSKIDDSTGKSSWGQPSSASWNSSSQNADAWGPGKSESGTLDKATEEDGSKTWDTKIGQKKTESSWGRPSESTPQSSPNADGWGSKKLSQSGNSSEWGSGTANTAKEEDRTNGWGKPSGSGEWKKRPEGGRGWGSSNSGEWKNRKNRFPKQPGASNDDSTNVPLTATRKRMDDFAAEEQGVLSEMEQIMLSIRRILHQSGCNDGEPLPSDDQSYIIDNVLNYHPDKAAKIGAGIDFITVKKHGSFQDSRCFFVVSTDGQSEDFSYIKCLESFVKGKYPSVAESFNSKYFMKRRVANRQPEQ